MQVRKSLFSIFLLFVVVNFIVVGLRPKLGQAGYNVDLLLAANLFLCILTVASFYLLYKGFKAPSHHAFLRSVYGSFILKLLLMGLVVFVYARLSGSKMNLPSVFTAMVLYLLYTFLEIKSLMRLTRNK